MGIRRTIIACACQCRVSVIRDVLSFGRPLPVCTLSTDILGIVQKGLKRADFVVKVVGWLGED
jgi:hypothetical protein